MIADAATMENIYQTISKAKNDVKDLIKQAWDRKLEAEPGRTMMESFENKVNQVVVCLLDNRLLSFSKEQYHSQLNCLTSTHFLSTPGSQ